MNTKLTLRATAKRAISLASTGILILTSWVLITKAQVAAAWTTTGNMTTPRYAFSGVQLKNGKVLVAGGISTTGVLSSAELFDPATGLWSATGNMRLARAYHGMALLPNGNVLVAGGCTNSNCSSATPTAELYNARTGTWKAIGRMSTMRYFFGMTSLQDGKVLVEGGCNKGNCGTVTATAELFNPQTQAWSLTGAMAIARDYHSAALLSNGKVLITGGYTVQGASNSAEIYDPLAGSWSLAAPMIAARALHSSTALADGRAVVAGGIVAYLPSNLTEVYEPATNTWTATGNLNTKRANQRAVLLPSGNAMVTGGYSYSRPDYFDLASCELFGPLTLTWSFTGSMSAARDEHAVVPLASGQVLAAGGLSNSVILSSAEIYTP
jgi:hypothetical protein